MKKLCALIGLLSIVIGVSAQTKSVSIDEKFENITHVEVNVIFSDVIVQAIESNTVSVKGTISWDRDKDEYEIKTRQSGTTLIVEVEHPRNVKGRATGKININMPAMTDIKINGVSGQILVHGVGQRLVQCNTVSGDIRAEKIGGNISANNVSGDIEFIEIKGNAKSNSVSGDVVLNGVDGNFKGNSVSGDFTIINLKGNREISTLSGSIR